MSEIISIPILELMKKTEQWLMTTHYRHYVANNITSATRKENWPKIPSVTVTECFIMRLGFPMILLLELS